MHVFVQTDDVDRCTGKLACREREMVKLRRQNDEHGANLGGRCMEFWVLPLQIFYKFKTI